MKYNYLIILISFLVLACQSEQKTPTKTVLKEEKNKETTVHQVNQAYKDQIKVLNFGTFHFTSSSDGHTSYIDIDDPKVRQEIKTLNEKIASFKPTVILVEQTPDKNAEIQAKYETYLKSDQLLTDYFGEQGLVAFEVGKLSGCKRIYGVDDHEFRNYDWQIGARNQEKIKDPTFDLIGQEFEQWKLLDTLGLIERLKSKNTQAYYDFMINLNMDDLHYVNSEGTFDATDQSMRMYHRNVRWFANINKLALSKNDRIFVLAGAAHTAFLQDLFRRSPKFELVDVGEILD